MPSDMKALRLMVEGELIDKREQPNVRLMRHLLGSIDLSDIEEKKMTETERREYCAKVAGMFSLLEEGVKILTRAQEEWMARQSNGPEQFEIGRGTNNGILLVEEHFQKFRDEHIQNIKEERDKGGKFDKSKVVADLEVKPNE